MSYDVWLEIDTGGPEPAGLTDWNYTSNCGPMWRAAGADLAGFHGKVASECLPLLLDALDVMRREPRRFEAMNPEKRLGLVRHAAARAGTARGPVRVPPKGDGEGVAMSDDLVAWLRGQLDEDERTANGVEGDGRWQCSSTGVLDLGDVDGLDGVVQGPRDSIYHMARFDPARVLAEVEAKRRILDAHEGDHSCREAERIEGPRPTDVFLGTPEAAADHWIYVSDEYFEGTPCTTVRLLALPYADRPGWDERWRRL